MNLWLHIGSPKTGSSSIQDLLFANRKTLSKSGLGYLTPGPQQASANRLAAAIGGRNKHDPVKVADACFARAGQAALTDLILSSEEFYLEDPVKVAEILAPHATAHDAQVHIVLYLRRQDLFVDSFYSQRRKTGRFRGSLRDFILSLASRELNYAAIVQMWRAAFPQAVVHLRRFERPRFPNGDLVSDFMQAIGHPGLEDTCERPQSLNPSPNRDVIALMDMLADTGRFNTTRIYRLMERQGLPDTGARKSFVEDATRTTLLNHYAKGNEALRAAFFPDEDSLFDMTGPTPDTRPETTFTPEQISLLKGLIGAISKA
ncbi:hypothetical protein FDP25_07775 [Roseovarius sp. A21]|uniref:Sulfotransferase family protein n=1 Tax=Roseovarius bejariae TaxID=2576383 RepID=A0A844D0B7_9RHOB|nr:hypothetical protein [Roseovarius bejariae]MRU15323.1 hypothetical protein [Roseovarius bejariae]